MIDGAASNHRIRVVNAIVCGEDDADLVVTVEDIAGFPLEGMAEMAGGIARCLVGPDPPARHGMDRSSQTLVLGLGHQFAFKGVLNGAHLIVYFNPSIVILKEIPWRSSKWQISPKKVELFPILSYLLPVEGRFGCNEAARPIPISTKMTNDYGINLADFKQSENDTGSADFQIALMTQRIKHLTEHMNEHNKDFASRRGLLRLVARRRKLLDYLKSKSEDRYQAVLKALSLRK